MGLTGEKAVMEMAGRNKKEDWRKALVVADLGLILALIMVIVALKQNWV